MNEQTGMPRCSWTSEVWVNLKTILGLLTHIHLTTEPDFTTTQTPSHTCVWAYMVGCVSGRSVGGKDGCCLPGNGNNNWTYISCDWRPFLTSCIGNCSFVLFKSFGNITCVELAFTFYSHNPSPGLHGVSDGCHSIKAPTSPKVPADQCVSYLRPWRLTE